jgi:hypothetical protein
VSATEFILALVFVFSALAAITGIWYCLATGSPVTFLRASILRLNSPGPIEPAVLGSISPRQGRETLERLAAIPLPPEGEQWWAPFEVLDPDRFVSLVWDEGRGNCSNRSLAFARWLQLAGIPFAIVTIGRDPLYRFGYGHTLIEVPLSLDGRTPSRWAVLDPIAGGVVMEQGVPVSYSRLLAGWPHTRAFVARTRFEQPDMDMWFDGSQGAEFLGYSRGREVVRFLRFAKFCSMLLGNGKRVRHGSMFLAVILGVYPLVRVDRGQSAGVSRTLVVDMYFARLAVWGVRLGLMSSLLLGVLLMAR